MSFFAAWWPGAEQGVSDPIAKFVQFLLLRADVKTHIVECLMNYCSPLLCWAKKHDILAGALPGEIAMQEFAKVAASESCAAELTFALQLMREESFQIEALSFVW